EAVPAVLGLQVPGPADGPGQPADAFGRKVPPTTNGRAGGAGALPATTGGLRRPRGLARRGARRRRCTGPRRRGALGPTRAGTAPRTRAAGLRALAGPARLRGPGPAGRAATSLRHRPTRHVPTVTV